MKKRNRAFLYHLLSFTQAINAKSKPGIKAKPQIAQISQMTEAEKVPLTGIKNFTGTKKF